MSPERHRFQIGRAGVGSIDWLNSSRPARRVKRESEAMAIEGAQTGGSANDYLVRRFNPDEWPQEQRRCRQVPELGHERVGDPDSRIEAGVIAKQHGTSEPGRQGLQRVSSDLDRYVVEAGDAHLRRPPLYHPARRRGLQRHLRPANAKMNVISRVPSVKLRPRVPIPGV
jgi:hypothetical protein